MENPNQNKLNATQEMLDQIKAEKKANQAILDKIQSAQTLLNQNRQKFETYQEEQKQLVDNARRTLNAESANHAKLDTVKMQQTIDDLNSQVEALGKEKEALQKEVEELKAHIQE